MVPTLDDRLAPREHAATRWNHRDRCAFHWFPGNPVLHVSQGTRFMGEFMFE